MRSNNFVKTTLTQSDISKPLKFVYNSIFWIKRGLADVLNWCGNFFCSQCVPIFINIAVIWIIQSIVICFTISDLVCGYIYIKIFITKCNYGQFWLMLSHMVSYGWCCQIWSVLVDATNNFVIFMSQSEILKLLKLVYDSKFWWRRGHADVSIILFSNIAFIFIKQSILI